EAERYNNIRSQAWWLMREDLRLGRIALPYDEDLFAELTTPTYKIEGGKIKVMSKEDIKKHLKRSTNKADAAVYGNFVRPRTKIRTPEERAAARRAPQQDRNR